jgi:hypothetical protein
MCVVHVLVEWCICVWCMSWWSAGGGGRVCRMRWAWRVTPTENTGAYEHEQVMQAVQKLAQASEKDKEQQARAQAQAQAGSLLRGTGATKGPGAEGRNTALQGKGVDPSSGKSGTWVGDVFYTDDEEEGDEDEDVEDIVSPGLPPSMQRNDSRDELPPHPPMPQARLQGMGGAQAWRHEEEEEFEEEGEAVSDQGEMSVRHVASRVVGAGADVAAQGTMRRGGLLRQLQGLGKAGAGATREHKPTDEGPPAAASMSARDALSPKNTHSHVLPSQPPSNTPPGASSLSFGRSPSQLRQDRVRTVARTQQKYAREWGAEWGAYRDEEYVGKLSLSQTVDALSQILAAQRKLLAIGDRFVQGVCVCVRACVCVCVIAPVLCVARTRMG